MLILLVTIYAIPMDVDNICMYTTCIKKDWDCVQQKRSPKNPIFLRTLDIHTVFEVTKLLSYSFQCRNACNVLSILIKPL